MTKSEQKILTRVAGINDKGALAGLGTKPTSSDYQLPAHRFVKRLADAGKIMWVEWTPELGAGWAIADRDPKNPGKKW